MFKDRVDAGRKLAVALEKYKDENPLILAIPRGGAVVGFEIAKHLGADFSIIIAKKLPFPENPEAGFGAVAEDGSAFILDEYRDVFSSETKSQIVNALKEEVKRRIDALRGGKPIPEIKNRIVVLIDDGIAMGVTMRAAIMMCKNKKAKKIIVAAPVSAIEPLKEIRKEADETIILETPFLFRAVAEFYDNFQEVMDNEVIKILNSFQLKKQDER